MYIYAHPAVVAIIALTVAWLVYWNPKASLDEDTGPIVTSMWCHGANRDERRCRFENLCYLPSAQRFIFSAGKDSIVSGVNQTNFFQELVDTSSMTDHNVLVLNMGVISAETSTKWPIRLFPYKVLAIHRFKPDHIMHTLHDEILPIFHTYDELCLGNITECASEYQLFFIDGNGLGTLIDLYLALSARVPLELPSLSELNPDALICFSHIVVGLSKLPVWYQYGFAEDQGAVKLRTHGSNMRRFTDFIVEKLPPKTTKCDICQNATVFLERHGTRKILNADEVFASLGKQSTEYPVVRVSYEDMEWLGLLHCFKQARMVVGMHGAALILAMFMQPGTGILELFPYGVSAKDVTPYSTLVGIPGMDIFYAAWENHNRSNSVFHPENNLLSGGIRHLPVEEQKSIEAMNGTKPGKCCYRPDWIYFMFQDTHVNTTTLEPIYRSLSSGIDSYVTKLDPIARSTVYPLNVQNPTCFLNKSEIHISWEEPWNLAYIHEKMQIKYNVLISYIGQYNVTRPRLRLEVNEEEYDFMVSTGKVLAWISCYHGDYAGLDKTIHCQW